MHSAFGIGMLWTSGVGIMLRIPLQLEKDGSLLKVQYVKVRDDMTGLYLRSRIGCPGQVCTSMTADHKLMNNEFGLG